MSKPFKIALGMNLQSGSFGGGNQFGQVLTAYLRKRDVTVTFSLAEPSIDVIILTDTRPWLTTTGITLPQAWRYVNHYPATKILYRVNECDEKRGTKIKLLNRLMATQMDAVDHVVFISNWLKDLFVTQYQLVLPAVSTIHNGGDQTIFNRNGFTPWPGSGRLKLVTHHWSQHYYKGFDTYQHLDALLGGALGDTFSMTYIGNVPSAIHFKNITVVPPTHGSALAALLKQHHAYLTASQYEPAGMHHIEAALCGLPLVYRRSGALPEYCAPFGVGFNGPVDVAVALLELRSSYATYVRALHNYPYTAELMCAEYLNVLRQLAATTSSRRAPTLLSLYAWRNALFIKETLAGAWQKH